MMTFMLTSIIVYLYTVLAFNFFRKFYVQEEEGEEPDSKCRDMLTVRRLWCLSLSSPVSRGELS